MKKLNVSYVEKEENAFALSTGDLMAGLLFIFILLLMGTLLQIQEKSDNHQEIINSYREIKTQLYIDLQEEFKDDLKVWSATIDTTLCIRFQEPSMLFDNNKAILKPKFKLVDIIFEKYNTPEKMLTLRLYNKIKQESRRIILPLETAGKKEYNVLYKSNKKIY